MIIVKIVVLIFFFIDFNFTALCFLFTPSLCICEHCAALKSPTLLAFGHRVNTDTSRCCIEVMVTKQRNEETCRPNQRKNTFYFLNDNW